MPPAEIIAMDRARERHLTQVTTHGAEEVNAVFREIDAHLEALPFLQEEALARFPHGDDLVTSSTADSEDGNLVTKVAPTAALLNFLAICRRAARARGLRVITDPPPLATLQVARVVEELMEQHGIDARLYEVARGLGLPLPGHAHTMGDGVGPL